MNTLTAIEKRKSIRSYKSQQVEPEKLVSIIKAGNSAPIYGKIHITVVENPALLKEINDVTLRMMKNSGNDFLVKRASITGYNPLYGAPVFVILSSPNGNDSSGFNMANVSCAAENMMLAATELELGSCYVMAPLMVFSEPEFLQKISIPQDYVPLCGVLLGYADGNDFSQVKSEKENVTYLR